MQPNEITSVRTGQRPLASRENEIIAAANAVRNAAGDGRYITLELTRNGLRAAYVGPPILPTQIIPAKITASTTPDGWYQWTEQVWDVDAVAWTDGINTYATLGPAYEITGSTSVDVGTFITLTRAQATNGLSILTFQLGGGGSNEIWVKLTSASAISATTNRWTYSGPRQVRTATGWTAYSPSTTISNIYNSREADNDGSGVQGNGIDISGADFPAGFSLKSLATGTPIVRVYPEFLSDGTAVWTCDAANAVDGTCDA